MKYYISTGIYVDICADGTNPITGTSIYTGYLSQCESDGHAYILAQQDAQQLRISNPCIFTESGTETTTTSTTTTPVPDNFSPSGFLYNWTGYFPNIDTGYYDIVAWGNTNGYLSGNSTNSNNYFTSISCNDIAGSGIILAITNSGSVTGFGDNVAGMLNIPNINDALQISVGYDHCLVLRSTSGIVTGWGNDQWGALSILGIVTGVRKVSAGMGSSFFLLNSGNGTITGTRTIGGNYGIISIPNITGIVDIDHFTRHVLITHSEKYVSGFGFSNYFGLQNAHYLNGIDNICAGNLDDCASYTSYSITGWGQQISNTIPILTTSGLNVQFKTAIGTVLNKDKSIKQWTPFSSQLSNIILPSYINNNVVAISQARNFTAAIFRRPLDITKPNITGFHFLWKVTGVDNYNNTNIHTGDLYPPSGVVIQDCDGYNFNLPWITGINQIFTQTGVTNCSVYAGTRNIYFISILQQQLLNINYQSSTGINKTGFAATGLTTGDYWNKITPRILSYTGLYYANNILSPISGGFIQLGTGSGIFFNHTDNMYSSAISGISGSMILNLQHIPEGDFNLYLYGHGPTSGQYSHFRVYKNGVLLNEQSSTSGTNWNSTSWIESGQYIKCNFNIVNNDYISVFSSGFINGLQLISN